MAGFSGSKYQLYLNWANSLLVEEGQAVRGLAELLDPSIQATLIDRLWPDAKLKEKLLEVQAADDKKTEAKQQALLDYLLSAGIKHSLTPQDVQADDLKSLQDLLWLINLNFSIHSPKVTPFQRNVRMGSRFVLNWCREHVPSMTVIHSDTLASNVTRDCVLIDLISVHCVGIKHNQDTVVYLEDCLKAAEEQLNVKKGIINAERLLHGKVNDETLLSYLSLLRRKVKQRESLSLSPHRRQLRSGPTAPGPKKLAWTL